MSKLKLFVLLLCGCFAFVPQAMADTIDTGSANLVAVLANSNAKLQDASGNNIKASDSGNGIIDLGSYTVSDVSVIDLKDVDLKALNSADVASLDTVFNNVKYLSMKLTGDAIKDERIKFTAANLEQLILSESSALYILDITGLTKLNRVEANNCENLRAVNLGLVTVAGSSMMGMGGSSGEDTVSSPLAELKYLDLSDNPNLDRVGYLILSSSSSDMSSMIPGGSSGSGSGNSSSDMSSMIPGLNSNSEPTTAGYKAHEFLPVVKAVASSSGSSLTDLLGGGSASYNAEDTSYPKFESSSGSGIGSLLGGGLSGYSGADVNLIPALETLKLTGTDDINYIDISNLNKLISADLNKNTGLKYLSLPAGNELIELDLTDDTALLTLNLSETKGFVLPDGFTTLTGLVSFDMMRRTDLTSIDVSNSTKLIELDLTQSAVEALDVTKNLELQTLNIAGNKIPELDLSEHKNLKQLNVRNNKLVKLDLHNNLDLFADSDFPAKISPQTRELDMPRSSSFNFIENLDFTRDEVSNILDMSIKGDGASAEKFDAGTGTAYFASAPYKITYKYATGLYMNDSDRFYMEVNLTWDENSSDDNDDNSDDNNNEVSSHGSSGCQAVSSGALLLLLVSLLLLYKIKIL